MKITWIGHSCFRIEKEGYTVIVDPYADGSVPGLENVREIADQVLCSHEHRDHNGRECVEIRAGSASPFTVKQLHTYHDDAQGSLRGTSIIHMISDEEHKIVHMGDLGCDLTQEQAECLIGADVLLIPVGGFYTIDAAKAKEIVMQLKPVTVIPMHFRDEQGGFGYPVIGTVNEFLEDFDRVATLSKSSIDVNDVQEAVVVLKPQNICQ